MSDDTIEPGKQLTNWEEELAKSAKAAAAAERPKLGAISLKAGQMTYEKVPVPGNKLQSIVVATTMERQFFKDRYDPNKIASPVCFAFHDGTDGVAWVPHPNSAEPQSETCALCPRNQWGSDLGGSKGKACKEKRKLALIPGSLSKEMALLSVPVMSVRNWSNYVNGIASTFKRPPWGMVTEISVRPDAKSQFVVEFSPISEVPDSELPGVYAKIALAQEVLTTPYDVSNPVESLGEVASGKKKKY